MWIKQDPSALLVSLNFVLYMRMRTLIPLLLLLALYSHAIFIKVNLQMDEHGVHYNQTEEYDPFTADVITYVPAHERDGLILHELTKIENESEGGLP